MANSNSELFNSLTIEDLTPEHADFAEVLGIDAFKNLLTHYGGSILSVPTESNVTRKMRNRQIVKEFNGNNIKVLTIRYELTDSAVRKILVESGVIFGKRGKKSKQ